MGAELLLNSLQSVLPALFLVAGVAGSVGVLGGALALGIRHGMDWDHIAAITDITSTTTALDAGQPSAERPAASSHRSAGYQREVLADQRVALATADSGGAATATLFLPGQAAAAHARPSRAPAFLTTQRPALILGTVYALGHGSMVVVLGLLAILFSEILPSWVDPIMERVVGVTLVLLGVYLLYSLYRYFRHGGEFRIRSRWMLVFSGVRRVWHGIRSWLTPGHAHPHRGEAEDARQYGVATSYGIGLIHGIGAETGTQVLIIGTAVGAASTGMSVATLFVFVFGLLISNSFVTIVSAAGFVSAGRRQAIYVAAGAVAAVFSLSLGFLYLASSGGILPDLDAYFRWIGGPDA